MSLIRDFEELVRVTSLLEKSEFRGLGKISLFKNYKNILPIRFSKQGLHQYDVGIRPIWVEGWR